MSTTPPSSGASAAAGGGGAPAAAGAPATTTSASASLLDKYQRLLQEFTVLKAQHSVLRKAVLAEHDQDKGPAAAQGNIYKKTVILTTDAASTGH